MPARPTFVGGTNPSGEIPVTGGSLFGKLANMPMETMQSPGGMFGGKGTAGSPAAPAPGGAPTQIQMGQQAQPIFGAAQQGQDASSSNDAIMMFIQQLLGGGGM